MKAFCYSLGSVYIFLASFANGQCSICPSGVDEGLLGADPTGQGLDTCAEIDIIYQGLDRFACLAQKPAVMPNCCPSQLPTYAVDNVCGWCPNGVPNVYAEIPDILLPTNTTCLNYMELVSFTEDSDGCSFFDRPATFCCPADAGPVFTCDFCSQGLDFPDLDPEGDGTKCSDLQPLVDLLFDEDSCGFFKSAELSCCPSTTELIPCGFCSKGLEFPNMVPFPDGATCTDLQNNATLVASGSLCDLLKAGEDFCCPSTTDGYVCDFCDRNVKVPNQLIGTESSVFGLFGDETCEDVMVFAALAPNASTCELVKSFEGVCCPPNQDVTPPPMATFSPDPSSPPTDGGDSGGGQEAGGDSGAVVADSSFLSIKVLGLVLCLYMTSVSS
ncbi:unnamed protein product [Cylindrotheca closterium]|uniref:Uncharacterized protein n=1 Tax=Cylindrotheca closterium TaxID=2856 RepID=A0AAD2G8B0_9STRA|nr:unnamed protein product [Cylindrotheca closterium]